MNETLLPETILAPEDPAIHAYLAAAVDVKEGERLERLYLFDPVERSGTSFSLAFVVKRLGSDRLEMAAIGGRTTGASALAQDFVRRARFPEEVLPLILGEFVERCGVEGAAHREVALSGRGTAAEQVAELAERMRGPEPA